ncbi:glycosyltransferase family 2 protein [Salinarimonas sp.]|uniref:glycosyltransferase family 2 protein n=1 Tax=Salinarimonas sp. TaxID=2766526 RepID=UPI0032D994D3
MSLDEQTRARVAERVSVVMPVYNRSEGVRRAVRSVLAQTTSPAEIIVVDDGSDPPLTAAQLRDVAQHVRLIRHDENRGAAAARQTGIEAARGDYIAFLDSDDVWLPDKLRAQAPLLYAAGDDLVAVACGWRFSDETGERTRLPIASADPRDFASGCWFAPGATTIVPRSAFVTVGGLDPNLPRLEDYEWFLRFALAGGRLEVAPVIGAQVAAGRRATAKAVDEAALRLSNGLARRLPPACARRLRAYLLLERAASRRNAGDRVMAAWLLFRSLLTAPRATLHLRRWWG